MNWDRVACEEELIWYFQHAASECGVRSSAGGVEKAAELRANCGRDESSIKLHELRQGRDNDPTEKQVSAYARARDIYNRLALLSMRDRVTLECAFGDVRLLGNKITVDLCCSTDLAGYEYLKYTRKDAKKRKHESVKTRFEWFVSLSDTDLVSRVADEAAVRLDDAMAAALAAASWHIY
jgi:hypothetical protein